MPTRNPTDLRRHRSTTDRNLLIGFFVVLLIVGGGLIGLAYGGGAAVTGVICIGAATMLAGLVALVMFGLERLSQWLDKRE
jgi:CHASE2 domain-containing sensor protein